MLSGPTFRALEHPGGKWTCPVTGISVRKGIETWADDRIRLHTWADANREAAMLACASSFLLWLNVFGCTYKVLRSGEGIRTRTIGILDRPFLTWPCQDEAAMEIIACIDGGRDVVIKKARDMGATWLLLAIAAWYFLFIPQTAIKIVSRGEDEVDAGDPKKGANDPDTLFWKIDYMLKPLPDWMRGMVNRTYMHLGNEINGSVIDGESTNKDVARGGRRAFIIIDEAAAIDKLRSVDNSTQDSTSCRIFNSTPRGASWFSKICASPTIKKVFLPWWDHPEKGIGRKLVKDKITGKMAVTAPWYVAECEKRPDPRNIAENLDMDETASGFTFFSPMVLIRQQNMYARPELYRGEIRNTSVRKGSTRWESLVRADREKLLTLIEWNDDDHGPWKVWCDLIEDDNGEYRPRQDHHYVLGVDVAAGVGGSNSVISVLDTDTGWKVAEFADAQTSPHQLADIAVWAGLWFGGAKGLAFLNFESNGPGTQFRRRIIDLGYPWVYYERPTDRAGAASSQKLGFHTNRERKQDVLGDYRDALARDEFKNPSAAALEEAMMYVYGEEAGQVLPGHMQGADGNAMETHGDRPIADAMANHGARHTGRCKPPERKVPIHSFGERHQERLAMATRDPDDDDDE